MKRNLSLSQPKDLQRTRRAIMSLATELGFSRLELTKLLNAAAELSQDVLDRNSQANISIEKVSYLGRVGIRFILEQPVTKGKENEGIETFQRRDVIQAVRQIVDQFEINPLSDNEFSIKITIWQE
ncbi:MAG: hypothetical protein ACFFDN_39355 [Candidatus Hodarchaeota archaeon]